MRLRTFLPLPLAVTAAVLTPPPAHALTVPTSPSPSPACAAPDNQDFPIETRIHGGPAAYDTGDDFRTWYIDLTNTTAHACGAIHPIVVLVDEKRVLRPEQARLEFYEGERPHPVTFETSDQTENVGAFDDGFPGFTVEAGRTLTVKVRLAVTSDAVAPNDVVANAAVVQRHKDDGDWVGQSNDYRFRIEDVEDVDGEENEESEKSKGDEGSGQEARADGGRGGRDKDSAPDQLASTGPGTPPPLGVTAALALFVTGAALFAVVRRTRRFR
ncbi:MULTISPECIES: hypothetical protein [Streptomyces]|uniref:Gram-positive cocci surface proteins LPxTG domain-containing protein n=1 Tax=Streptomyces dengpaensis TaxID=2049881 RepID=A0ABM6SW29_9ACTN|nr:MULTISPECIES: hypothetical protein [Streptomyces]AVH58545.1 hypothetical protein C4B68_25370 [Streptomyces dengpaensis]PIB11395.1 hypothetical protein B1C81_06245 [Streptomyces sp. HG99]